MSGLNQRSQRLLHCKVSAWEEKYYFSTQHWPTLGVGCKDKTEDQKGYKKFGFRKI